MRLTSDFLQQDLGQAPKIIPVKSEWHRYSDWLRLASRHHTHELYTKVYSEEQWREDDWLDGHDAMDRIICTRLAGLSNCDSA